MKRIKTGYWILSGLFIVITIILSIYFTPKDKDWASLFLSGLAIVFAIIAIGFSDKKLPKFKGQVSLWTNKPKVETKDKEQLKENVDKLNPDQQFEAEEKEDEVPIEIEHKVSIRIENFNDDPVTDIKIKIRTPHKITDAYPDKNVRLRLYKHGYTYIFFDDSFGILGNTNNKDYLHYDLKMKLGSWKSDSQGNFYITINGSNIQTTTYVMKWENIPQLKIATYSTPLLLKPL